MEKEICTFGVRKNSYGVFALHSKTNEPLSTVAQKAVFEGPMQAMSKIVERNSKEKVVIS